MKIQGCTSKQQKIGAKGASEAKETAKQSVKDESQPAAEGTGFGASLLAALNQTPKKLNDTAAEGGQDTALSDLNSDTAGDQSGENAVDPKALKESPAADVQFPIPPNMKDLKNLDISRSRPAAAVAETIKGEALHKSTGPIIEFAATNDAALDAIEQGKIVMEDYQTIGEKSAIKDSLSWNDKNPKPEAMSDPSQENVKIEGLEVIPGSNAETAEASDGENAVKELEKLSGRNSTANIKRSPEDVKGADENNRPSVAANIRIQRDKSTEKGSEKFSGEENSEGRKKNSAEKKQIITPLEAPKARQNAAPIKLKSHEEMNLPQERAFRMQELAAELPRAIANQADGAKSAMSFKLTPETLGTLFVEIEISRGEVKAKFTAETKEAQAAIEANMPSLKEKLADAGLKLTQSECAFERRDEGSASFERQRRQNSPKSFPNREFSLNPETEEQRAPGPRTRQGNIIEEFV